MKASKDFEGWTTPEGDIATHLPAIPPNDYKGSIADWITGLVELGFNEGVFYGDVLLTVKQYDKLLEECERR
jgi:hypothetical protein